MRILSYLAGMVLFVAGISAMPQQSMAWGKFGHLTVCDLAYRNFTKATRDQLNKLFEIQHGGIDVEGKGKLPDRHYTSFNLGCLEEDELPRKHPEDHFINVDRTTKAIVDNQCPAGGECILSGVGRDFDILKDTSKPNQDRVFALMALGHWIGDIHQPLHVSFSDDRGGNAIDAKVDGKCGTSKTRPDNLHAVWDNCLLEAGLFERVRKRADFKKTWGLRTITYRAVDTLQANTTLAEEKSLVGTDPWKWANESYQITLSPDVLYCVNVGNACQYSSTAETYHQGDEKRLQPISQAYLAAYEKTAQERVKKAGFRLAHIVNLALDPSYTEPVQNSTQSP